MKILVVGGRSGIGRVIAEHLRDTGAEVVVASRRARPDLPPLAGIAEVDLDAADPDAVAACLRDVAPEHVVATCADNVRRTLTDLSLAESRASFDGKFWTQFNVARAAVELLPPHGSVVLFSGVAAQIRFPKIGIAGVINAAIEKLVLDLSGVGPVRVNCVSPGMVQIPSGIGGHPRSDASAAKLEALLPTGRAVTGTQVAMLVHHLIVNDGATGTVAKLDGGHQAISGSPL